MKRSWQLALLSILAAIATPFCRGAENPDPAALLKKLMTDDFDERAAAERQLEAIGESARPVLLLAIKSDDAEVRESAQRLLGKLNRATLLIAGADRDGKPATGAEAEVLLYSIAQGPQPAPLRVPLKADGTGSITDQTPGPLNMNVTWKKWFVLPGQPGSSVTQLNSGINGILHTLTRGGTVHGKILDADGKPIKDAKLHLSGDLSGDPRMVEFADYLHPTEGVQNDVWEGQEFSAESDADGVVSIEAVQDGVYHCHATCTGFSATCAADIRVREGQTVELPEIKLKPKITGKLSCKLLLENGKEAKSRQVFVSLEPIFSGPDAAARQARFASAKLWMLSGNLNGLSTDEDAKLTMDNVVAGKYSLRIRLLEVGDEAEEAPNDDNAGNVLEYIAPEITIAGEELALGSLKPAAGITVSGRILSTADASMDGVRVVLFDESELIARGKLPPINELVEAAEGDRKQQDDASTIISGRQTTTRSAGKFELKRVQPGKYVLACVGMNGASAVVFGVEVKAGEALKIPEIKLTAPAAAVTALKDIKGKVFIEDNKLAANAQVTLHFKSGGSWGNVCDNNGHFEYGSVNPGWAGDSSAIRLTATLPGYKPKNIDLTDAKLALGNLDIRLEKRKYGKIAVKVVDPDGHPITGATVTATSRKPQNGIGPQQVMAPALTDATAVPRTDKAGSILIDKQPEGPRALHVQYSGYYDGSETIATVPANDTVNVTITLKRGLPISGKVELPADAHPALQVVYVGKQSTFSYQSMVVRDGAFSFSGFEPGNYVVTAAAPGLVPANVAKVTIKEGQAEPATVVLKMVKSGAAALNLDPRLAGYHVDLTMKDTWKAFDPTATDPARDLADDSSSAPASAGDRVDAVGRVELFGPAPGSYDAILTPDERLADPNPDASKIDPIYVLTGISVQPLKAVADLRTLAAGDVKFKAGTAKLSGRFTYDIPETNGIYGSMHAKLVGTNSYADWYPVTTGQAQQQKPPALIGTPPQGLQFDDPNTFHIAGLPAGEYQLYVEFRWYNPNTVAAPNATPTEKIKPQMAFTIKDGEVLDLKEIKVNIPPPDNKLLESVGDVEDSDDETPLPPDFRP